MKRAIIVLLLLQPVLNSFCQQNSLTQTVKGIVTDEQSGSALASVTILLEAIDPGITVLTDTAGVFKLKNVPIGRRTLRISYVGYEEAVIRNIEVTSSHEVVLEIKLKEKVQKLTEVVVTAGRQKNKAINEAALVSARQFSVEEAVRYAGSRNDPSRMAQNFAGVSGANDARNDIIVRGNSPAGVLWRMEGIDIPNPNHFSTLGSTGGPVTIINTNTLKNSDFLTSAFPAQYGNAIAAVFDLRMRNGNSDKYEFLGQMGFNGFEFGAEGPLNKKNKSSFLVNYRYSLIAAVQAAGLNVGTGTATPYYQDAHFKIHIPTKKAGTFDWFGMGGESHINFPADIKDNLYASSDGSLRDRVFNSLTGVTGLIHTYFFSPSAFGKATIAVSGFQSNYKEIIIDSIKSNRTGFEKRNGQFKYSIGYTFNKKFSAKNQLTTGIVADINQLSLNQDLIKNGDTALTTFVNTDENAGLIRAFFNWGHRFTDKLSTNAGIYYQLFTLNRSQSIEPRWNLKYQFKKNQSLSLGAGMHSQTQPLEVYFYETSNGTGGVELTNKNLDFVKSLHGVLGYDVTVSRFLRLKTEIYGQYIYNAAVEKSSSSFSMINSGADFYFPDKTNLLNNGNGYNYGIEITIERFLDKGFYYLFTGSLFQSKYTGSDKVWRNTAFNSNLAINILGGKEFKLGEKSSFGIDTKLAIAGGQRYTPFDLQESENLGYIVFEEQEAYSLKNDTYLRWDLKFSYTRNGRKATQKFYIDFQNVTNKKNLYVRTLNPKSGNEGQIDQIGFFPNVNYQITF